MQNNQPDRSLFRRILRWTGLATLLLLIVLIAALLWVFRGALYHRVWEFPREAASWTALAEQCEAVELENGWGEYRGILHTHSKYSHDSEVEFPAILAAAKEADINFLFMSDHCVDSKADFSWQWHGLHDGVLFVPGFEMQHGFLVWDLPVETVFDCFLVSQNPAYAANKIEELGGTLFYAHSEEDRLWDDPVYRGMEIYNIHTDFKDEGEAGSLPIPLGMITDMILNHKRYPSQTMRGIFDRQTAILQHWDELNQDRKIVGMSANDAHQNIGVQIFGTESGGLLIRDTGPDKGRGETIELNVFTRFLARLFLGKIEAGKLLFRYDFDPYAQSVRTVNTHLLSNELTQPALVEALRAGRAFVAFDMLADARGFAFVAEHDGVTRTMGEEMPFAPEVTLKAASPVPCRFTLIHDGDVLTQTEGREFTYTASRAGQYRIEAEVRTFTGWQPWVYTNPITLTRQ